MTYLLDAPAQALWRTSPTSVRPQWLFLHQPEVVFKAQIVDTGIIPYPMFVLLYDNVTVGDWTDIEEDMLMLIGSTDGADDLGRVRVRKNFFGNTASDVAIYFQNASQGILDGEINLQDNAYITILNHFPIYVIPPLVTPGGQLFKDTELPFDIDYHLMPVANAGVDRLFVVPNITDDVTFNPAEFVSYVTKPGASITDYLWTTPDGQTSTLADPTFTIAADTVGYMKLEVTDDAGNTTTSRRFLAVVNEDHANLFRNFEIVQHTAGIGGQQMSIRIHDPIPYNTYIAGAEALITMRESYGSTVGSLVGVADSEDMLFAGFTADEAMQGEWSQRGYLHQTTITLQDTAGRMRVLPGFTQLIERETTPANWGQMEGANLDRYAWYLLYWHSNVPRRADFMWSGTGDTYGFQVLGSDTGNLFDQVTLRARAIRHELTCDRYGRLQMLPDPQLQAEADRTSDVMVPVGEADWQSLSRNYNFHPRHHWQFGEKIVASTVDASSGANIQTVFTIAPGTAPGSGLAALVAGEELVTGQAEANAVDGARYRARTNARESTYDVQLTRLGYAVDPALMKWVQFEVTAATAGVRGRTVSSTTRFLTTEIQYQWDQRNGIRMQRWTIEREGTQVIDAVTEIPPETPGFELPDIPIYPPPTYVPNSEFLSTLLADTTRIGLIMYRDYSADEASLFTTTNGTNYTETTFASLGIGGLYQDFQQNPFDPSGGWVLTDTEVGYISDLAGTPSYAVQDDLGLISTDVISGNGWQAAIHTNIAVEDFVVVAFWITNASDPTRDGFYIFRTTDGSTWSGGKHSTNVFVNGLWVSAHVAGQVFVSERFNDGSGRLLHRILRSTDYAANFSTFYTQPAPGGTAFDYGIRGFHVPYYNNADDGVFYFSRPKGNGAGLSTYLLQSGTAFQVLTPNGAAADARGFEGQRGMDSYASNRNILFGAWMTTGFVTNLDVHNVGAAGSEDAGATWTPATVGTGVTRKVAISGNDPLVRWAWGQDGTLLKTITGLAADLVDISGDLPDAGVANMDNAIQIIFGLP